MTPKLAARNLAVVRGGRTIVDVPALDVPVGGVLAIIGPNGSGKSTLLLQLALLERPDAGEVLFEGQPARGRELALRRRMAVVYQEPLLLDRGVQSNVETGLALRGVPRAARRERATRWLARFGVDDLAGRSSRTLSGGEAQRVSLARAFALEPEVLFLDEPTDGVDPVGRRQIRDILLATRATGTTIFINSHLLSEVERTCDRVAILHRGRVIREGTVESLTRPTQRFRVRLDAGALPPAECLTAAGVAVVASNGTLEVEVPDLETLNRLVDALRAERLLIAEISPLRAALEDVFVEVVGEEDAR